MTYLERALKDGHAEIIDEGKKQKIIIFGQTQRTGFQKICESVEVIEITDRIIHNYQLCDLLYF